VLAIALGGCFVRLGNMTNSEIIGKPTNDTSGFVFVQNTTSKLAGYIQEGYIAEDIVYDKTGETIQKNGAEYPIVTIKMDLIKETLEKADVSEERVMNQVISIIKNIPESDRNFILPTDFSINTKNNDGFITKTFQAYAIPRHPTQLYESATTLLIFFVLIGIYYFTKGKFQDGVLTGIFLVGVFTLRMLHETLKENQVSAENAMEYNLGQKLSIPIILFGLALLGYSFYKWKQEKSVNSST
jgi:prolipoprotein diacylglyceryltransferase